MTLQEIAALANTSVSTVSKAFSGGRDVGSETRERIFAIARKNGCFEKYYKGPREKKVIAVLCPETESENYGRLVGLFEQALSLRDADSRKGACSGRQSSGSASRMAAASRLAR